MWQDVIALTVVAVTIAIAARGAWQSARRAGASACGDCHGCAQDSDTVISADTLHVFSPPGRRSGAT
ncbi:hypothetical protein HN371_17540 [Candidatus Poribacteria bacterium]|jgi:hypothetical protein|nr:hypothetical protein [Candidatus Poribacteria bacterium]MBT5712472.1 hypothetical protein [Candidatus Poribacteria bacterium]